jgi:hypothetical protein
LGRGVAYFTGFVPAGFNLGAAAEQEFRDRLA